MIYKIALAFLLLTTTEVCGQTTVYRDGNGRYTGRSYTTGRNTYYRNSTGRYVGRDYTNGRQARYFGPTGGYIGRSYGPTKKFPR